MPIADDITNALQAGANAGAAAASTAGRDLRQDVNNFVAPHLRDIGIQLASIVEKRVAGTFTDATAKALIDSEEDAIQTLVETMLTLAVLEAQTIVNAIVDALNKAVNTALGFTFLAWRLLLSPSTVAWLGTLRLIEPNQAKDLAAILSALNRIGPTANVSSVASASNGD